MGNNARAQLVRHTGAAYATALTLLLGSCAGPAQAPGPVAATAQFRQVKLLSFQWTGGEGATSFRVARVDGGTTVHVAEGVPSSATGYDLEVFLPEQLGAEYVVEACNAAGCTASDTLVVARGEIDGAIGYVKAGEPSVGDQFGISVALSSDGRLLLVGAPLEDGSSSGADPAVDDGLGSAGAVFVYAREAAGDWSGPTYLKSPLPGESDFFGWSVAVSAEGVVLAVGAHGEDGSVGGVNPPHDDLDSSAGAVYLFERDATGVLGPPITLKGDSPDAGDFFGYGLALSADGGVLAVGAPLEDGGGSGVNSAQDDSLADSGAVWVFERSAAGAWVRTAYVKATNPSLGDQFGSALALSADGTTLVVGSWAEDGSGAGVGPAPDDVLDGSGAAYAYVKDESGTWVFDEYLKAGVPGADDGFGLAVALTADGSLLAVGAAREDGGGSHVDPPHDDTSQQAGAVYLFSRGPGGWTGPVYLKADAPAPDARFGAEVALSEDGSMLVVGAPNDDGGGTGVHPPPGAGSVDSGAVWVYRFLADGLSTGVRLKASNTGIADIFGVGVAVSGAGDVLAVGAPFEDGGGSGLGGSLNDDSLTNAGAVYLY